MEKQLKILLLEDNRNDAEVIHRLLKKEVYHSEFLLAMNESEFIAALDNYNPDIILSDNSLPQFSASKALEIVHSRALLLPFILITGTVSEEYAAGIIKKGADDYILKDRLARLPAAIEAALRQRQAEKDKVQAAAKLAQSEEQYRNMFLKSPLPKWIYDSATLKFLEVNEAAINHYGYSAKEFLQMTIKDIRPKEEIENLLADIARIGDNRQLRHGNWVHTKKNGERIIVETSAHPIRFNNNNARMVIAHDITEKIQAEQATLQSQQNLKAIFDNSSEGFVLLDEAGTIKAFNNRASNVLLINSEKKMQAGKNILDFVEPGRKKFFTSMIASVLKGETVQYDRSYQLNDGTVTWMNFSYNPVKKADQISGVCITASDITNRKRSEEELRRLEQEQLLSKMEEQKKITLAILTTQEKERNAIGTELHDNVNQILVATNMMLSIAKNEEKVPERSHQLISDAMYHLQEAIRENRKIAHVFVTPDLESDSLLDQLKKLVSTMLETAGIKVDINTDAFDETLLDSDKKFNIYRIAQEQFTNIIKYAKASTVTITLTTIVLNEFSMIIKDNGIGMKAGKKTTGIGLRNIKGRLELFNGTASIRTEPGKGFTLEILLPV